MSATRTLVEMEGSALTSWICMTASAPTEGPDTTANDVSKHPGFLHSKV